MASDINSVVLIGRLTRDAELKYITTGTAVAKFSIANNWRKRTGEQWVDEVNYFDVVLWGKSAESLSKYLTKGVQLAVQGELRQNRWEQDGQPRSKVEIVANNIELLGSPRGGQRSSFDGQDVSAGADSSASIPSGSYQAGPETFDDDIPF